MFFCVCMFSYLSAGLKKAVEPAQVYLWQFSAHYSFHLLLFKKNSQNIQPFGLWMYVFCVCVLMLLWMLSWSAVKRRRGELLSFSTIKGQGRRTISIIMPESLLGHVWVPDPLMLHTELLKPLLIIALRAGDTDSASTHTHFFHLHWWKFTGWTLSCLLHS